MSSEGDFTTIAEDVVDENLTLILARGDGVPRLGICNTSTNKKKYTYLSWAEGAERSLKIKKKSGTAEYPMETIQQSIARLVEDVESDFSFKSLVWRGLQVIGDIIHFPRTARNETDCTMINEKKRDTIWFAYAPKGSEWRVRPCFIQTPEEKAKLSHFITEGTPWPGVSIAEGSLPLTMRNAIYAKEVINATPSRWSEVLMPITRAALFGFCDWSAEGGHDFGEALWKHLPGKDPRSEDALTAMMAAGREYIARVTAYLRLWPVLDGMKAEAVEDFSKTGDELGLKKRERFELISVPQGERRFKLMRYESDDGRMGIGMAPDTRAPGEKDRFFTFGEDAWNAALEACSMGGQNDPQFACFSIIWALEAKDWLDRVGTCTKVASEE